MIDRRRVSARRADNYIFYGTFKGQTYIGVIGIFTMRAGGRAAEVQCGWVGGGGVGALCKQGGGWGVQG